MNVNKKSVSVVWLIVLLLCVVAQCQQIVGPTEGPVKIGQPMHFQVLEGNPDDQIIWQTMEPLTDDVTAITSQNRRDYIVDTGCSYRGDVRVLCTVVNFQTQTFIQTVVQAFVDGETPTPPGPGPGPSPGEYNGTQRICRQSFIRCRAGI